jgi:8-oxo-dGTP diphosphatase
MANERCRIRQRSLSGLADVLTESSIARDTSPPVHVVAGVIEDARGRILIARRTVGRDLAGLWEFPGGKVEPGESPEQALARELREELGIEATVGAPLIRVPQQYPHKRLVLDVRRIAAWRGNVKGLDGQALAWAPLEKLAAYPMPPGDRPVVAALCQPDRYLITPEPDPDTDDAVWLDALVRALADDIRCVQLRAHACSPARWRILATQAAALCREAGAEALLNGDMALASELGTGLHLRAAQLRTLTTRPLPAGQRVFASCHDREELLLAQGLGCDAAVLGPVLPTASHPGAPTLGWDGFAALREHVSLPLYALGGMRPGDIDTARAHGAQGIAAIRGLWPGAV